MRKIIKTTTVGSLKNKLNESKGTFALGQGFGSETRFKSNVNTQSNYNRRFDTNGGLGLGDGFTQLNEEEMVDFIADIVENMKGKTEYHNLRFVDRIGNKNGLFESHIKNIKNIIKSDRTPYQLKLRKYLTENVAVEMEEIYEGYSGLMHESEMMVNEIKSTFNEIKSMGKTTNEAVTMTAEALDVPMEMVGKMVEIQKEAYKARMEGMGETMNINEKLCEVYEAYQNMAEGNMKPVYEEIKEMMNPEESSEPIEPPYGSLEGEEGYEDFGTEELEINPETGNPYTKAELAQIDQEREAEHWINQDKMYAGYGDLEEGLCMECDDEDGKGSYIEVDLVTPEDFKLLPMLAKGAMSASIMPSMGMDKYSMDAAEAPMNRMSKMNKMNRGYEDYEVPMDYSVSNPYSQYTYDTGLSRIPYGKKKISSLEGDEDSFEGMMPFNESLIRQHLNNTKILQERQIKFIIESLKIKKVSKCGNFLLIENKVFDIENKKFLNKNNLLSEAIAWKNVLLIAEARTWGTWWANLGQNLVSVASAVANVFVPGSGMAIEFVNGLVYLLRGYFSAEDVELQNSLYLNGVITIAFTLFGAGFGGGFSAIFKSLISSGKLAVPVIAKGLVWLLPRIGQIFAKIINFLSFGLSGWLIRKIARFIPALAKGGEKLTGKEFQEHIVKKTTEYLSKIQTNLTTYINTLLSKGSKEALAKGTAETAKQTAKTLGKLAGKEGFDEFLTKGTKEIASTIIKGKAAGLFAKLGIVEGKNLTIKGVKYNINKLVGKGGNLTSVQLFNPKTKEYFMVSPAVIVNGFMRSKGFKGYVKSVFSNPSANALGARFLNGFIFGKDGTLEDVNLEEMPNIPIDLSLENIDVEVAGYQGDTGQYTERVEVTAIQTALQALGENIGSAGVDGKYGPATKSAINKVESELGVTPTAAGITTQTIINMITALVKANKNNEAINLIKNSGEMSKNALLDKIKKTLEDPTVTDKISAITNVSTKKLSTYEKIKSGGFFGNSQESEGGLSMTSENTFSESYKRIFGLTLD